MLSQRNGVKSCRETKSGHSLRRKQKRLCTIAYSDGVGFSRHFGAGGVWKKFTLEFQRGPAFRVVKTRHREKEIFNTRYRVFISSCRRTICRLKRTCKNKKSKELWIRILSVGISLINCFFLIRCGPTASKFFSCSNSTLHFLHLRYFAPLYFLFYVYFLFTSRNICDCSHRIVFWNLLLWEKKIGLFLKCSRCLFFLPVTNTVTTPLPLFLYAFFSTFLSFQNFGSLVEILVRNWWSCFTEQQQPLGVTWRPL